MKSKWLCISQLSVSGNALYWCDAHSEKVESSDLLGRNRRVIVNMHIEGDPFGLALQGAFIYWTDWNFRGVHRSGRDGSAVSILHDDVFSGLNDVKFFNKSALTGMDVHSYQTVTLSRNESV